jgi:hypothetical protein
LGDAKVAEFDGSLIYGIDSKLHYAQYGVFGRFFPEPGIAGLNDYGGISWADEPWPYGTKSRYFSNPVTRADARLWPADELFDYGLLPIPQAA